MNSTIKTDEHVFICGMTGTGKSFFAEAYLANYEYVIKLDSKGEYDERKKKGLNPWRGLKEGVDFEMVRHLEQLPFCECPKIIYCPAEEEADDEEFIDEFFRFCYERENTMVWVDELMSVASASRCPHYLRIICTRGRSRNVALWACSQRPADIPSIVTANSTHFIVYKLMKDADRKRMYADTGCPEMLENPKGKFTFWYFKNNGMENAIHAQLIEKKGG